MAANRFVKVTGEKSQETSIFEGNTVPIRVGKCVFILINNYSPQAQ